MSVSGADGVELGGKGAASPCPLCKAPISSDQDLRQHYLSGCAGYENPKGGVAKQEDVTTPPPAGGDSPDASSMSDVEFMWQPLTDITYPKITLLASFEPNSIELRLMVEDRYYQSERISIPKGTYEGQLVIGDNYVHAVQEFTVSKDKEIVILQMDPKQRDMLEYQSQSMGMQRSSSYAGYDRSSGTGYYGSGETERVPGSGSGGTEYDIVSNSSYSGYEAGRGRGRVRGSKRPTAELKQQPSNDPAEFQYEPSSYHTGSSIESSLSGDFSRTSSSRQRPDSREAVAPQVSSEEESSRVKAKNTRSTTATRSNEPHALEPTSPGYRVTSPYARDASHAGTRTSALQTQQSYPRQSSAPQPKAAPQAGAGGGQNDLTLGGDNSRVGRSTSMISGSTVEEMREDFRRKVAAMREQLDAVDRDREHQMGMVTQLTTHLQRTLQAAQVDPQLQSLIQEMEGEIKTEREEKDRVLRQLVELHDHNKALQEQLSEYKGVVQNQTKLLREKKGETDMLQFQQDYIHLAHYTRKQQLEYAEALASKKKKTVLQGKASEENLHLHQLNTSLAAELDDYRRQTKMLLADMQKQQEELARRQPAGSDDSQKNQLELELETMKQKCDAWKEEAERLLPIEGEYNLLQEQLRELEDANASVLQENSALKGRLQEDSERSQGELLQKATEYDSVMERLVEVQRTRAQLESELVPLREERSQILRENAHLREGSQPEKYAKLKVEYDAMVEQLEQLHTSLDEERSLVQKHQDTNLQLQQRLSEATDPEQLQSIRGRVDRYKQERDSARIQLGELQSQMQVLQHNYDSAVDAQRGAEKLVQQVQDELALYQKKANAVATRSGEYETRMRRYREERNVAQAKCRSLDQKIATLQATIADLVRPSHSPDSGGLNSLEEPSLGSLQDHSASSSSHDAASAEAAQDQYAYDARQRTSELRASNQASPTVDEHTPFAATVKTKEGLIQMLVQKPTKPLDETTRPTVVVEYNGELETGVLLFLGTIKGNKLAGVQLDNRRSLVGEGDGTYIDGKKYFKCSPGYGMYISPDRLYVGATSVSL